MKKIYIIIVSILIFAIGYFYLSPGTWKLIIEVFPKNLEI